MGPHAVVTGATRGFGLAVTDALLDAGFRVTTIGRSPQPDRERRRDVVGDVTDRVTIDRLAHVLGDAPLDLLVNNAGMTGGRHELDHVQRADMERSFATNVVAPLEIVRACRPNLAQAHGALVVNVTSRLASVTRQAADHYRQADRATSYGYRITKAAQNMLSTALAHELAAERIAVWAVHPGRLTTRLGSAQADTPPDVAAAALLSLIGGRDPTDLRPRFISLDSRETPGGGDLPW